jgi:hypothetical protein
MHKVHHTLVVSLLVVSGLVAAGPAFAQAEVSKDSARFYQFEPSEVPGRIVRPSGPGICGLPPVKFGRLLVLKKSVRPALLATSRDLNLK